MGWRIVIIENEGKLSIKNKQLIFKTQNKNKSIPIEDIDFIILDNRRITLTHPLLDELAQNCILLMTTNEKHEISGILFSYWNQYRKLEVLNKQIDIPAPLKKQIWKKIIEQKILNQSLTLKKYSINKFEYLNECSKKVKSGDSSNLEAITSAFYFNALFSGENYKFVRQDFKCSKVSTLNAALNYTYSIVRSIIIKYIVGTGFIPYLGIFHKSKTNSFNLADDLMEAFRPIADYHVYKYKDELKESNFNRLDKNMRKEMQKIYLYELLIDGKWTRFSASCRIMTFSFLKCINENNYNNFLCPLDWRINI